MTIFDYIETGDSGNVIQCLTSDPRLQEERSDTGFTPLLFAIRHHRKDIIDWLLANGADPNVQANGGQTCLMWACYHADRALLHQLLEHGLDLNAKTEVFYWDDEEDEHQYILQTVIHSWLPQHALHELLDFFEQHESLMIPDVQTLYKRERLTRILKNNV